MSDKYQQLNRGTRFYPGRGLDPADVSLEEIAHALDNVCRFGGHCREFYSVVQHSLLAYDIMRQLTDDVRMHLAALLHDAAEAYVGDMPTPLKDEFPEFREYEEMIQACILERFGIEPTLVRSKLMHLVDTMALKVESDALFTKGEPWACDEEVYPTLERAPTLWDPAFARSDFVVSVKSCLAELEDDDA